MIFPYPRNLADRIGVLYLLAVELPQFQTTKRSRITEKDIRVLLENLPNKSFRKITVYQTVYRIKSLVHSVPLAFW